MVVAGAHPVEQGRVDLEAERLPALPGHRQRLIEAAPAHLELQLGLVGEQLVLDDVTGELAVHGDDLVAGLEAGPGGR